MILILAGGGILGAGLLITDGREAAAPVTEIRRNTYGQGSLTRTFRVFADGREQADGLEITVRERRYTQEEMSEVFGRALESLDTLILGENQSLDRVCFDLDLMTEIPGEPLKVSWELDRYDLINIYGELNEENLREESEGALVNLKACLSYTEDESMEAVQEMAVKLYPRESEEGSLLADLRKAVELEEEGSREEVSVSVPVEIDGTRIQLRAPKNLRGWYVLALGPVICILLLGLQRQNEQKEQEKRDRQMMLDYPEIMNKLTLLLGAGMTVKSAWQKIVRDYEGQRRDREVRYAYEEMAAACHEMQSGVAEAESYERFGKRCGLKAYRKLAALLSQNLRKGTKGLTELLSMEAVQAFEERKAAAKRRGEEAGTKLLGPMFLMLAMVLVIVIVPAFLSIQM